MGYFELLTCVTYTEVFPFAVVFIYHGPGLNRRCNLRLSRCLLLPWVPFHSYAQLYSVLIARTRYDDERHFYESNLPKCIFLTGVDDMFVIVQSWNNLSADDKTTALHEKFAKTMKHAGVAITVTSLTDFISFAIGGTTVSSRQITVLKVILFPRKV